MKKKKKKLLQLQLLQPQLSYLTYITKEEGMEPKDHTVGRRDERMNVTGRLGATFQADQTKGQEDGPDTTSVCWREETRHQLTNFKEWVVRHNYHFPGFS